MITTKKKSKNLETIVGLDIGTYSIKAVVLSCDDERVEIQKVAITPTSSGKKIQDILSQMDLAAYTHLRVSLSGPSTVIRRIQMPIMTSNELKGAIRFEAEAHIPFPTNDCVLDFQILLQDDGKKQMHLLLVAAKRDAVDARYKILTDIGLFPEIIDLDVFSVTNAFDVLNSESPERVYALLNIGHKTSALTIIQDGKPFLLREIPCGGQAVTRALATKRAISEEQADEIKIKKSQGYEEDLKNATKVGLESLTEEVRSSIDYVENELGEEVSMIWVSGGGALSLNLEMMMSEEVGRKVVLWDNSKKLTLAAGVDEKFFREHSSELDVALGIAVRGMGKK